MLDMLLGNSVIEFRLAYCIECFCNFIQNIMWDKPHCRHVQNCFRIINVTFSNCFPPSYVLNNYETTKSKKQKNKPIPIMFLALILHKNVASPVAFNSQVFHPIPPWRQNPPFRPNRHYISSTISTVFDVYH
ncbi:uncharacterized protein DS421_16g531450 [Arachis hypogaea]|nr:uncharacterized protein DS421_16g531450 [Arachis hypogaea]